MEEKTSVSRVKKTTGTYRFRVEGYSALSTKVGDSIESPEFVLCGHDWQLRIFLGGSLENHKGYLSYYLASKSTRLARASYKLMIISQVIGGLDEIFCSSGVRTFEPKGIQVDGWGRDKFINTSVLMDGNNGFFLDDSIVFKVEITVIGELENAYAPAVNTIATDMPISLYSSISEIFSSGNYADVTIFLSDNTSIKAHRCILCARSPVFRAMLSTSGMNESSTGEVHTEDIDYSLMFSLLHFLYTDELPDYKLLESRIEELFDISSMYQVAGLVIICEDYLTSKINDDTAVRFLVLADNHGSTRLKERCIQFIIQNHEVIVQSKDFQLLDGELLHDTTAAIESALKRKGCRGNYETERKFANPCTIM
eukprot:gene20604-26714_t